VLDIWVRQRKALTLEKAVRKMTAVPAQLMGMRDRGVLEIGKVADIALFDPSTVKSRTPRFVNDLPGGARRLVADAEGVAATIVAGRVVVSNGEYTGERPGRVLRAGRC
jgi:N-acyl-D-amino-acid deacylase